MRSVRIALGSALLSTALLGVTASAQDTWSAPAQGVRRLHRELDAFGLEVITADLNDPQVRVVRPRAEDGAMTAAEFSERHDAFVALGGAATADASRALSAILDGGEADGAWLLRDGAVLDGAPAQAWGAVGRTASNRLVVVVSSRGPIARERLVETLRGFEVARAVALVGAARPPLLVGGRAAQPSVDRAVHGLFGLRVLPGASWYAAAPEASDGAQRARVGAEAQVWFTARNTGQRAWRGDEAPTLRVETDEGTVSARPQAEVAPGAVGRFVARWTPRTAGARRLHGRLFAPDGAALLDDPIIAELAVAEAPAVQRATRVQAAGFSLGAEGGPTGVAWAVLSVFGSAVAALCRRARREG